ncbi:superoxide dismutase [Mn] 1, mitochondrial [Pararge aegeria]|uniref:Superoxide dismutase n=2 Tax=Pararge aegeria TaxID=116150 RepID=A0A8S4RJN3_9NEOP|nr:superoxide dismutase [Mn] 1, mitochondrial [Pararge aegeria]CAH2236026.1 jg7317 [Pararge aegeria aegeria]
MLGTRGIVTFMRTVGASRQAHTLPELPYDYNALEPVISREIMSLHHSKHHATYVNNLNAAEEKLAQAQSKGDISTIISLAPALKFNGGGHINHTIFWQNLSSSGGKPSDAINQAIQKDFGSMENMKNQLALASVGVQGSGWGWLGYNKLMKKLQIATCQNQDPLEATTGIVPLFGIDVWEHAYYLQYKNVRADYVKAIFEIANWKDISARYEKAIK